MKKILALIAIAFLFSCKVQKSGLFPIVTFKAKGGKPTLIYYGFTLNGNQILAIDYVNKQMVLYPKSVIDRKEP